jgi:c-di-GMP-binding flagellar brake protein YcgR
MKKKTWSNAERRKFLRLRDNIFIFGKLKSSLIAGFKAVTRDISGGGLMFEAERNIPAQSELEMEIYQPMSFDKNIIFSIPVLAKVIWAERIEKAVFEKGENRYRIGIKFLEIKEEDRRRIVKHVKANISKK